MFYNQILNNDLGINNHFIGFLQLFFFNKPLYSFFNSFCLDGKKGLTLKFVLLLLNNLKNKTLLSPVVILKSVILNYKLFFKINETKFRRKTFYSVSHLDSQHQVKYSIGNLNRHLRSFVGNNRSDLVDTLTKFFLSFFLKDDDTYKTYINNLIDSNQNINEIFSDMDELNVRSTLKPGSTHRNHDKLYLNTLFNKYLGKISTKTSKVRLGKVNSTKYSSETTTVKDRFSKSSKFVKRKNQKFKGKNKLTTHKKKVSKPSGTKSLFNLNNINISYNKINFIGTPLSRLDISDVRYNQYYLNYNNFKNKIIFYFMKNQLTFLYLLMESVYNYIFNFTVGNILDEVILFDGFNGQGLNFKGTTKEGSISDNIKMNFHSEIDSFILWLIHIDLKSNIGINFVHNPKFILSYKWMLYSRSLTSYLYKYYSRFYKNLNKSSTKSGFNGINVDMDSIFIEHNSNEFSNRYKKNIFFIFKNYIKDLKYVEEEKYKKKKIVKKLQEEDRKKKLIHNIRNSFKKKVLFSIGNIINRVLPHLIRQLGYDSDSINYKKNRKYISYKFKRMRVIGYY